MTATSLARFGAGARRSAGRTATRLGAQASPGKERGEESQVFKVAETLERVGKQGMLETVTTGARR